MDATRVEDIHMCDIPIQALRSRVRGTLASMLNQRKQIPSPENFYRDYRGLAELMGLEIEKRWTPNDNHVTNLLERSRHSLADLQEFLERIDRFDVLDDCRAQFFEDAIAWWEKRNQIISPLMSPGEEILTIDEVLEYRIMYDAFLLYVDADIEFATEIVKTLESQYNLKICVKDRLAGGVIFEHTAIMELISERCHRMIVLLSDEFVSSDKETFLMNFGQFLSLEKKINQRFIVPVKYKPCNLPKHYLVYFMLDHMRHGMITDFWKRLYASVVPVSNGRIMALPSTNEASSESNYIIADTAPSTSSLRSMIESNEDTHAVEKSASNCDLHHFSTISKSPSTLISSTECTSSTEAEIISPVRSFSSNPDIAMETTSSNISRRMCKTVQSKLSKIFKGISRKRSKNISRAKQKQVACVS